MWIFTRIGFASVVEHRDDANLVVVRSRARIDLQRIVNEYFAGNGEIVGTPSADYPFRFTASKSALRKALSRIADEITYTNFKQAASEADDAEARLRGKIYASVWSELRRLEELNESLMMPVDLCR